MFSIPSIVLYSTIKTDKNYKFVQLALEVADPGVINGWGGGVGRG